MKAGKQAVEAAVRTARRDRETMIKYLNFQQPSKSQTEKEV